MSVNLSSPRSPLLIRASLAFAALLALVGCPRPAETVGCKADRDCANFEVCEFETGFCLCADDQACDATEFCNGEGRCQPKLGCTSNADCRSPERPSDICDTTTSECVTLDPSTLQCVLDSHCPFGAYCDQSICRPGCRVNGDCGVDTPCIDGQCDARPGACNQNAYCDYGQSCDLDTSTCVDHVDADSLCQWCSPLSPCPGGNSCLIDTSLPIQACQTEADCSAWPGARCEAAQCYTDADCAPGVTCEGATEIFGVPFPGECSVSQCERNFCGSDGCGPENPCPRGYSCSRLIIVSQHGCTSDAQCPTGSTCIGGGENENQGFCSCLSDADCPNDPFQGIESECVDPGPNGACVIGTTCGPAAGLLCEDVR